MVRDMEDKSTEKETDKGDKKDKERKAGMGNGTESEAKKEVDRASQKVSAKLQRIVVSNEARDALKTIIDKVNDGFSGGKVNLTEIANWIIIRSLHGLNEAQINEIRSEHFDEVAMLESILKEAKASGKLPKDFKTLLQKQLTQCESTKRKTR